MLCSYGFLFLFGAKGYVFGSVMNMLVSSSVAVESCVVCIQELCRSVVQCWCTIDSAQVSALSYLCELEVNYFG